MKNKNLLFVLVLALTGACTKSEAPKSAAKEAPPPAAKEAPTAKPEAKEVKDGVQFTNLKDGAEIAPETVVNFGVSGKTIRPAGEAPDEKTSGHHHVIIDGAAMAEGTVIPMDATHLHFGKGQTTTTLQLAPGPHTLTLQFADGAHRSYGPAWASTVKVTVVAPAKEAPAAPAPTEEKK